MTNLSSNLNVKNLEIYGITDPYFTGDQLEAVTLASTRVNGQLDWLAQLLGWSGPEYWFNLVSNVEQKRNLLAGTFGVYNSFIYPRVREVRNWDNSVVIDYDSRIKVGQTFYLGDNTYVLAGLKEDGDSLLLDFGPIPASLITDLASGIQLKVHSTDALPRPFLKPDPQGSADISLKVVASGSETFSLFCETGLGIELPVVNHCLFEGSRAYFDAPVYLTVPEPTGLQKTVEPVYDFSSSQWYVDVPTGLTSPNAVLNYNTLALPVTIVKWSFDGGWTDINLLSNYTGAWSNKGGKLPFNFVFDSLGIHGLSPEKAVSLDPITVSVSFNQLLDLVYYQRAKLGSNPILTNQTNQVWWNNQTGSLSVFRGDCYNCGPWVEVDYPNPVNNSQDTPGYVFPDVVSFQGYGEPFEPDTVVRLLSGEGLSFLDSILALNGELTGECEVDLIQRAGENFWRMLSLTFPDVPTFNLNSDTIPGKVPVVIESSIGLAPEGPQYRVLNLGTELNEPYKVILTKDETPGVNEWYISPPSHLKYIGNTKLFDSEGPLDGEMFWDYSESNEENRAALIFYYSRWENDGGNWELRGDWIGLNDNTTTLDPSSVAVNYGALKVFCNGTLLEEGVALTSDSFQMVYTPEQGVFTFEYVPVTFEGVSALPIITITDSLTTTHSYNITDMVFGGARFHLNPTPLDKNTPLRTWKTDPLVVTDLGTPSHEGLIPNLLIADQNNGPADDHWERYFIRLSPLYKREGKEWQKVNLVCQDFGLWGSPAYYEDMEGPLQDEKISIYEDAYLFGRVINSREILYSEPYLYSNVKFEEELREDYENSAIIPGFETPGDGFSEAKLIEYDPLHNRKVNLSDNFKVQGEWEGDYVEVRSCQDLTGFLTKDIDAGSLLKEIPPTWDASIYKIPPINNIGSLSAKVDANHYKINYAFFAADLSAAEEAVFDLV
jgi:hypothetical protein